MFKERGQRTRFSKNQQYGPFSWQIAPLQSIIHPRDGVAGVRCTPRLPIGSGYGFEKGKLANLILTPPCPN